MQSLFFKPISITYKVMSKCSIHPPIAVNLVQSDSEHGGFQTQDPESIMQGTSLMRGAHRRMHPLHSGDTKPPTWHIYGLTYPTNAK